VGSGPEPRSGRGAARFQPQTSPSGPANEGLLLFFPTTPRTHALGPRRSAPLSAPRPLFRFRLVLRVPLSFSVFPFRLGRYQKRRLPCGVAPGGGSMCGQTLAIAASRFVASLSHSLGEGPGVKGRGQHVPIRVAPSPPSLLPQGEESNYQACRQPSCIFLELNTRDRARLGPDYARSRAPIEDPGRSECAFFFGPEYGDHSRI